MISRSTVGSVGLRLPRTLGVPSGLTTCGLLGLESPPVAARASRPPARQRDVPTPTSGPPTSTVRRFTKLQPTVLSPDWPAGRLPPHLRLKLLRWRRTRRFSRGQRRSVWKHCWRTGPIYCVDSCATASRGALRSPDLALSAAAGDAGTAGRADIGHPPQTSDRCPSVYSTTSATQLSHLFDSFESQQKASIPAFLHIRMADLVHTNSRRCASH